MPISGGTIPDPSTKVSKTQAGTAGPPKKSQQQQVAELLQSGSSLSSLVTQFPGYSLANLAKMRTYATFCSAMRENKSKLSWPPNLKYQGACSVTRQLVEWCSLNIHSKRNFKQKQLYLHGPKNTRKSSFLHILMQYCTTYEIPQAEDFYDLYGDPEPELCCLDEYKGGKYLHWWNLFLQGGPPMTLRVKGGQIQKKTNPPVIILSNYDPKRAHAKALEKNDEVLDPFLERITVIEVPVGTVIDTVGFLEALASATYATTLPPVTVSDAEMTNVLSTLLTLGDNQLLTSQEELLDLSISPPSSPEEHLPRRSKRSREKEPESPLLIDTNSPLSENSSSTTASPVSVSSLDLLTSSSVLSVTESETSYSKFKKYRRTYDDFD